MAQNSQIDKIKRYLSHVCVNSKLDRLNMTAWVYDMIVRSDAKEECFEFFLANADSIDSDDAEQVKKKFTQEDLDKLKDEYGTLADAIFEKLLKENLAENHFYSKLWNALTNNPMLDSNESIIFSIYYILIDARIPYYKLSDGVSMPNSRFATISNAIQPDINKARFIMRTNRFAQRTNRASVLLELLDSKDGEERVVLMAHILTLSTINMPDRLLDLLRKMESSD